MIDRVSPTAGTLLPPDTPQRVVLQFRELLAGYQESPLAHCKTFDSGGFHDLVSIRDIQFYSLCEHHLIPFFGRVHVGYLPNGQMLGLSKFGRIVEVLARRMQTQERLTHEIAQTIWEGAAPTGLVVQVEAEHLCMAMRGVRQPGTTTVTSELRGRFEHDQLLQQRFYQQLNEGR